MHKSKMKIYAVPLARLGPKGTKPLVYFHSYLPPPPRDAYKRATAPAKSPVRQKLEDYLDLIPNAPLVLQLTTKASSMWTELGHAKPTNTYSRFKIRAHALGERLMDQIECEEWSLKAVERGLVPPGLLEIAVDLKDKQGRERVKEARILQKDDVKQDKEIVELYYPPQAGFDPIPTFQSFLTERQPFHAKRLKQSFLAMPIASLFGIIPIIPNFPFMYVSWRAWSHWKARNAASLLVELLDARRIQPAESALLDRLLPPARIVDEEDRGRMLISKRAVEKLVRDERLPEASLEELMRAFKQAEERLAALPPPSSPSSGSPSSLPAPDKP